MDRRPSGLSETERNLLSSRNFLIVAFVLFLVLKTFNALFSKKKAEDEAPAEPTTKVCPYCQSEIAIRAVRCPHCTSKLEGFPEINEQVLRFDAQKSCRFPLEAAGLLCCILSKDVIFYRCRSTPAHFMERR